MNDTTSSEIIGHYLTHITGRSFSPFTIRRRKSSLTGFARWVAPVNLLDADGEMIEEWVSLFVAARTRHAYRSDLSAFFGWAVRRRLVTRNPVADTDAIRVPRGLPRPVPADEIRFIVMSAPGHLRLALALAAYAGLRRSEIVALSSDDIALHSSPPVLAVRDGKGSKDRLVPLHPILLTMLERRHTQGRLIPWTPDGLGQRAARHIRACGSDHTLHHLRASFATELARVTKGNVVMVSRMLGHDNVTTSMTYVGWSGGDGGAAVDAMFGGAA